MRHHEHLSAGERDAMAAMRAAGAGAREIARESAGVLTLSRELSHNGRSVARARPSAEAFALVNDRPRKVPGYRTVNEACRGMLRSD